MAARVKETGEPNAAPELRPSPASSAPRIRSLDLMRSPHPARPLAWMLVLLLVIFILALVFVPWQQSVTGVGRVIVFSPMDRPQNIEAQIPGRLVRWHVVEGQAVKVGEAIVELSDIDSKFLDDDQLARLRSQKEYQTVSRVEAESREGAIAGQLADLERSRNVAIPAAEQRVKQSEDRIRLAEQNVEQARQNVTTADLNLKRLRELFGKGLRSQRDLELGELEIVSARTRLESMHAALEVARRDLDLARLDLTKVINDTSAQLNAMRASRASVRETIAKVNSDLLKLEVDIQNVRLRTDQKIVRAPRDGKLVRVLKVGPGETVKAGDVLAVLAPETADQAVELTLSAYDAPLVSVGRQVRLNFAGWPALQFVGWPSIAVGTFAGRVKVMDAVDDGQSRFRIIVAPDDEAIRAGREDAWPPLDQLRPGAEVNGWVMLDTVPLGWELWRQFNAFPPTVERGGGNEKDGAKGKK